MSIQNQHQWVGAVDVLSLIPTQAVSTTEVDGAGLDLANHNGNAVAVLDAAASTTGIVTVKLQTSPDANKITSQTYAGTGNGKLEVVAGPDPVAETITFTASGATTFAVSGSVSGSLGNLTVGTRFTKPQVVAMIEAGSTAFVNTDVFTVPTTARTWTDLATLAAITTAAKLVKAIVNLDGAFRYLRAIAVPSGTTPSSALSVNLIAPTQYS